MKNEQIQTLIMGHKNPDTDSVSASCALAEFKRRTGLRNISPCRCGMVGERTEYLFKKFNTPLPQLKQDVYPRVKDILMSETFSIREDEALFFALDKLNKLLISRIPVVDSKKRYKGMLSLFSMLSSVLQTTAEDSSGMTGRNVYSSLDLIVKVLEGEPISLFDSKKEQNFSVYVAAMNVESFKEHLPYDNPESLAIIVGDRTDIHLQAINLGTRLIIVTGARQVDPLVLQVAKERNISIVKTPLDSATVVRRLKFSTPVRYLMKNNVECFRLDDCLKDIKHSVMSDSDDIFPVINRNGELCGCFNRTDFAKGGENCRLILVDHNEFEQSVEGIYDVNVIEVVDHHRFNMPAQNSPIRITCDIVGSTCTLIAEMFLSHRISIPKNIAGIMQGGIITDTLLLRSPTSCERDRIVLEKLEKITGVKSEELMHEIFTIGSVIAKSEPDKLFLADSKNFVHLDKFNFTISQVEEVSFDEFYNRENDLLAAAKVFQKNNRLDFFGLLVTNVEQESSIMLAVGSSEILDNLPFRKLSDNLYDLPGVLSRKKQLLPQILKLLDSLA